ncbi:Gfo/Idh/MocA family protein [Chloroflexota bacterium]
MNRANTRRIKIGVIGCSRVAAKTAIPAMKSSDMVEVSMIGSRSLSKSEEYAQRFGCKSFGSYDDVLRNDDVSVVYVSLPVGLGEDWVIKAAEAGKNILCEKSSTTSLGSARRMVEACKRNNVRILESFSFRYHPQHNKISEMITRYSVGDLFAFNGSFGFPMPAIDNIRMIKGLGGGVLNDAACYPICASRIIFQTEPIEVMASLAFDRESGVDVKASIFIKYPEDRVAFIAAAFGAYFQSTYSIWGSKAIVSLKRAYAIPRDWNTSILFHANDKTNELKVESADQFRLMIDNFCEELLEPGSGEFNFEDDLLAQARVMEAARLSNKKNRFVRIDELE